MTFPRPASRRRLRRSHAAVVALIGTAVLSACAPPPVSPPSAHTTALSPPPAVVPESAAPSAVTTPAGPESLAQGLAPPLPAPREEAAAAAIGTTVYVIGGFDVSGRDLASVVMFDGTAWTAGPPLPIAVDHPAAASVGNAIVVVGGFHQGAGTSGAFELVRGETAWRSLPHIQVARGAAATVAADSHHVVVTGGKTAVGGAEVADTEVLDIDTLTWSPAPALPLARDHLAGFAYQGMACVAGGRAPATTARVDCLTLTPGRWSAVAPLPVATSGAGAAAAADGSVVVAGGEDAAERNVVAVVMLLSGGTWTAVPMLAPRHGFQLVLAGGKLWAPGGGTYPGLHPVATCTTMG